MSRVSAVNLHGIELDEIWASGKGSTVWLNFGKVSIFGNGDSHDTSVDHLRSILTNALKSLEEYDATTQNSPTQD